MAQSPRIFGKFLYQGTRIAIQSRSGDVIAPIRALSYATKLIPDAGVIAVAQAIVKSAVTSGRDARNVIRPAVASVAVSTPQTWLVRRTQLIRAIDFTFLLQHIRVLASASPSNEMQALALRIDLGSSDG